MHEVQSPCARIMGITYKFGIIALYSVLTATLSSMLTSARFSQAVYRWEKVQDMPEYTRSCTSYAPYLDMDFMLHTQSYLADDNDFSNCLSDLENGDADVWYLDVPILEYVVSIQPEILEDFMVIDGDESVVLASAFAGDAVNPAEGTFEQGMLEAQDAFEYYKDVYFPSSGSSSGDDSGSADEDNDDNDVDFDAVPLAIIAVYALVLFSAEMIINNRNGRKCLLPRLALVCKNECRKACLQRRLHDQDVRKSVAVDLARALPDATAREVFVTLDVDNCGLVDERMFDALTERVAEVRKENVNDTDSSNRAVLQIKALLLKIFNSNVNGVITPVAFQDAFDSSITSPDAKLMLREVAWYARNDAATFKSQSTVPSSTTRRLAAHVSTLSTSEIQTATRKATTYHNASEHAPAVAVHSLSVEDEHGSAESVVTPATVVVPVSDRHSNWQPGRAPPNIELRHRFDSRRRATMIPPLEREQVDRLAEMMRAAAIPKRDGDSVRLTREDGCTGVLDAPASLTHNDVVEVVERFGRMHGFSEVGTQNLLATFGGLAKVRGGDLAATLDAWHQLYGVETKHSPMQPPYGHQLPIKQDPLMARYRELMAKHIAEMDDLVSCMVGSSRRTVPENGSSSSATDSTGPTIPRLEKCLSVSASTAGSEVPAGAAASGARRKSVVM